MEITNMQVTKVNKENSRLLAMANIVIDDALSINGIKVISGNQRIFVSMPSHRTEDGLFKDIVHPINHETRKLLEDAILREYSRID